MGRVVASGAWQARHAQRGGYRVDFAESKAGEEAQREQPNRSRIEQAARGAKAEVRARIFRLRAHFQVQDPPPNASKISLARGAAIELELRCHERRLAEDQYLGPDARTDAGERTQEGSNRS